MTLNFSCNNNCTSCQWTVVLIKQTLAGAGWTVVQPKSSATTIDSDIPERIILTTSTAEIIFTITEQNVADWMLIVSEITIFTYIHKYVNTVDTFNRIPEILKWS